MLGIFYSRFWINWINRSRFPRVVSHSTIAARSGRNRAHYKCTLLLTKNDCFCSKKKLSRPTFYTDFFSASNLQTQHEIIVSSKRLRYDEPRFGFQLRNIPTVTYVSKMRFRWWYTTESRVENIFVRHYIVAIRRVYVMTFERNDFTCTTSLCLHKEIRKKNAVVFSSAFVYFKLFTVLYRKKK